MLQPERAVPHDGLNRIARPSLPFDEASARHTAQVST